MTNRKKFFIVFIFIIIDSFLLISFLVIRDATFENTLRKEIASLQTLDITKDRYNTKIKSRGNYALIEKTIKTYLDNYAKNFQEILNILNDDNFKNLLSANNYLQDGPNFTNSFSYINETKIAFNKKIDNLILDCNEEKIKNYINTVLVDPYYINLYQELMLNENTTQEFIESRKILEETKTKINNFLDVSKDLFTFLKNNSSNWKIENGEIKFQTQELLNEYIKYTNQILNKN